MKPIRVALETQFAFGTPTGLGTYARKLAGALRARTDVVLLEIFHSGFDIWRFDRRVWWDQVIAPQSARRLRPDVTHFTGGTLALLPPHPCVLTLHDLAWLSGAVRGRLYSRVYFGTVQRLLARKADRVAADTATARDEIVERLGIRAEKISIAGAGVDEEWFAIARAPEDPPYVLAVGTIERRKDLETAVRALVHIPQLSLVSVGAQTQYAKRVQRVAQEIGVANRVHLRGYVDDPTLRALYAKARALVFPSRYEGFGLPPLQALAARLPVVASAIPVLQEVLGDCALFAKPGDEWAFADGLKRVLADDAALRPMLERGQMRAREFTWTAVAQRLVGLYRELV